MILKVNPHKIELLEQDLVNEKEIDISKCEFEFNEIPNDYVKEAYFTLNGNTYKQILVNNECKIPNEVLVNKGMVEIGCVAYKVDRNDITRYNPSPVYINTLVGSLKQATNTEPVTPTDKEQMEQAIQDMETKVDNLDIDAEKVDKTTTITITKKDGTQQEVEIQDGEDGVSLEYNWSGTSLGIKREDEQSYEYVNLKGDTGEPGQIEFIVVQELPLIGNEGTIYLVPYAIVTVQELPSTGQPHTIYIVSSINKRYVYESGQWIETTSDNKYVEYIYVNNQWEELGGINVDVDLSDYYTKEETNRLIPTQLSELTDDNTHRLVTDTEKTTWNNKSDFSGNYNDLSNKPDLSVYQLKNNLVTSISSSSTDTQYPSAKCVYDIVGNIETILTTLDIGGGI